MIVEINIENLEVIKPTTEKSRQYMQHSYNAQQHHEWHMVDMLEDEDFYVDIDEVTYTMLRKTQEDLDNATAAYRTLLENIVTAESHRSGK